MRNLRCCPEAPTYKVIVADDALLSVFSSPTADNGLPDDSSLADLVISPQQILVR